MADEFRRFFMPAGLRIEYTTRRADVHGVLLQIGCHLDANPPLTYHLPLQSGTENDVRADQVNNKVYLQEPEVDDGDVNTDDMDYDEDVYRSYDSMTPLLGSFCRPNHSQLTRSLARW